jgi:hypothetical protein
VPPTQESTAGATDSGIIHSFFTVPNVATIPAGFGDNFDFTPFQEGFPTCSLVFGDTKFGVNSVSKLVSEALRY